MKKLAYYQESKKWIVLIFLFALIISVFSFTYKGFFSRYLQDDYCYGGDVLTKGFANTQYEAYTGNTEYNGNRYALTFLSGIAEIAGGTSFERWIPGMSIILWLGALILLINQIFVLFYKRTEIGYSILSSLIILTFTLYLAPDLYQVFYWRSGSFPYLVPLILNTFIFARVINLVMTHNIKWFHFIEIALISFISAGFSETAAVWQFGIWSISFLFLLVHNRNRKSNYLNAIFFTVLAATILGILLLIFSPSNVFHLQAASVKRPDLITFLAKSFRFGFDFLHYSLQGKWLPFLVIFLFGFMMNQFVNQSLGYSKKEIGLYIFVVILVTYLISVISTMPTVLIRSVYPEQRAWFPTHYFLVFVILLTGFLTSEFVTSYKSISSRMTQQNLLNVILAIVLLAYIGRMIPILYSGIPQLRDRAFAWDQREVWIIEEKNSGVTHITVPAFDSIGGITELQPEENHWVNVCAARYYRVDGITAVENFNGIKPYFK